jgi:hypothetical protein
MVRRLFALGILATIVGIASTDLAACGDKFLRPGRSARMRSYAAVHPASIVILRPSTAKASDLKQFQGILKQAGHTSVVVENQAALLEAVADGSRDLVFAAYAEAFTVEASLASVPSKPNVMPLLYKASDSTITEARQHFHALIETSKMDRYQALDEIERLMKSRPQLITAALPR